MEICQISGLQTEIFRQSDIRISHFLFFKINNVTSETDTIHIPMYQLEILRGRAQPRAQMRGLFK